MNNRFILLIATAFLFLPPRKTSRPGKFNSGSGSRGIRNNNPGNIRITNTAWQGKVPVSENTDGSFEQFYEYIYGVRAMIVQIERTYASRGLNTIEKIIKTYAPSSENDTEAYIKSVSERSGLPRDKVLSQKDYKKVIIEMARVENGVDAISEQQYSQAKNLV